MALSENVKIMARIRPFNEQESSSEKPYLNIKFGDICFTTPRGKRTYSFDEVFRMEATQEDVFKGSAELLVMQLLLGYNCTIIAYGQRKSGKTYTLFGPEDKQDQIHMGLVTRTLTSLFSKICRDKTTMLMSYYQVNNELISDLLEPSAEIMIYKDSVEPEGLSQRVASNIEQVHEVLEQGRKQPTEGHRILCIQIILRTFGSDNVEIVHSNRMNFIDLGSGDCLQPVNNVISAWGTSSNVLYDQSNITKILKESLGGNSKTYFMVTLSPLQKDQSLTRATLKYAQQVGKIVNTLYTEKNLLKIYQDQVVKTQSDLLAVRNERGTFVKAEEHEALLRICEKRTQERVRQKSLLFMLTKKLRKLESKESKLQKFIDSNTEEAGIAMETLEKALEAVQSVKQQMEKTNETIEKISLKNQELRCKQRAMSQDIENTLEGNEILSKDIENLNENLVATKASIEDYCSQQNEAINSFTTRLKESERNNDENKRNLVEIYESHSGQTQSTLSDMKYNIQNLHENIIANIAVIKRSSKDQLCKVTEYNEVIAKLASNSLKTIQVPIDEHNASMSSTFKESKIIVDDFITNTNNNLIESVLEKYQSLQECFQGQLQTIAKKYTLAVEEAQEISESCYGELKNSCGPLEQLLQDNDGQIPITMNKLKQAVSVAFHEYEREMDALHVQFSREIDEIHEEVSKNVKTYNKDIKNTCFEMKKSVRDANLQIEALCSKHEANSQENSETLKRVNEFNCDFTNKLRAALSGIENQVVTEQLNLQARFDQQIGELGEANFKEHTQLIANDVDNFLSSSGNGLSCLNESTETFSALCNKAFEELQLQVSQEYQKTKKLLIESTENAKTFETYASQLPEPSGNTPMAKKNIHEVSKKIQLINLDSSIINC